MIKAKNLVKQYGGNRALNGVSFSLEEGKIYGFLGPNGAGKSTTMNIITGCLAPTEGEVYINGVDIFKKPSAAKKFIGYLPETPPLYSDMTPKEYLIFVGRAKGLKGEALESSLNSVMERVGLVSVSDRLIRNLSKGYKQRVGIAQAIIGDPKIIILDEPTVGLDPLQIIEIRRLIKELGEDHTVILSSHILTEISEVCDHVIIISHGEIVAGDTIENLTGSAAGSAYVDIEVKGDAGDVMETLDAVDELKTFEIKPEDCGVTKARLEMDPELDVREKIFFLFAEKKLPIISMEYEEITLEKIFLRLTSENEEFDGVGVDTDINENTSGNVENDVQADDEIE